MKPKGWKVWVWRAQWKDPINVDLGSWRDSSQAIWDGLEPVGDEYTGHKHHEDGESHLQASISTGNHGP